MKNNPSAKDMFKAFSSVAKMVATAAVDSKARARIAEIDAEMTRLQQERDILVHGLVKPYPSETVSEAYEDNSRLVECAGSWRDNDPFDKSHPGCPYRKTQHVKHDFRLRD